MPELFDQSENTNPNLAQRIAFGRALNATENMTFTNFITWITGKLGFFKISSNLGDPGRNVTTMRSNLGVYSTLQVDTALLNKADKFPTSGGALKTNNTTSFTPTTDYHPATKKYVDDNSLLPLFKGYTAIGDPGSLAERTVSLGTTLSTSNYMIVGELYELANPRKVQDIGWGTFNHATTSFGIVLRDYGSSVQNLRFYFMIYAASSFTSCTNA